MKPIKLSPREHQVLGLMVQDCHFKDIARRLGIEQTTVTGCVHRIRVKLSAKTSYGATVKAVALGLIEVQP